MSGKAPTLVQAIGHFRCICRDRCARVLAYAPRPALDVLRTIHTRSVHLDWCDENEQDCRWEGALPLLSYGKFLPCAAGVRGILEPHANCASFGTRLSKAIYCTDRM